MNIFEDEVISFIDFLNKENVRYILVGGLAVNFYGYSRSTGDVDLWIEDVLENKISLVNALIKYGVKGAEVLLDSPLIPGFSEVMLNNGIYIDMMGELQFFKTENFNECYDISDAWNVEENISVKVLHLNKLIEEKEKSHRAKDIDDAIHLKRIRDLKK